MSINTVSTGNSSWSSLEETRNPLESSKTAQLSLKWTRWSSTMSISSFHTSSISSPLDATASLQYLHFFSFTTSSLSSPCRHPYYYDVQMYSHFSRLQSADRIHRQTSLQSAFHSGGCAPLHPDTWRASSRCQSHSRPAKGKSKKFSCCLPLISAWFSVCVLASQSHLSNINLALNLVPSAQKQEYHNLLLLAFCL